MAKRIPRPQADDGTAPGAPGKAKGRAKARRELGAEAVASRDPDTVKQGGITAGPETISEQLEDPGRVQQAPGDVFAAAGRDTRGPSEDEVRERAYLLYLERGGSHGMDFEDWLRAERELKQRR